MTVGGMVSNKKIVLFALFFTTIIAVLFVVCNRVFSYNDTITHPSLTDNIARIYNVNFNKILNGQGINWLKQGSIEEDRAPRWLNHFYDPINKVGLIGGFSSVVWAESPFIQMKSTGENQTWQRAINSYVSGDEKEAFIALGHILHLLEDATVPAHTRLDAHPLGDQYESYVANKIGSNINFSTIVPTLVNSLESAFDDLANYSSNNFLSQDTIQISLNTKEIVLNKRIFLLYKDNFGNDFRLVEKVDINGLSSFILSDLVHSDYFSLLAPKAISYGAGVIKLFFDEAEKAKREYEQKNWWDKLKDRVDQFLAGISGTSLYAGISMETTLSPVASDETPEITPIISSTPISLPSDAVEAREKIVVNLPVDTVEAQEKLNGQLTEETTPDQAETPPMIAEETLPNQAKLPIASPGPSPLTFLPGGGGAIPTPSPSSDSESDNNAPETAIINSPASLTATTTAVFNFQSSEAGSTFECQLDNATSTICISPLEYSNLSEGSHNFKVKAKDSAGNGDITPAEYSWTIDLTAPQLSGITSSPGKTSATISWISSETGVFQIEYGTTTNYALITATTSAVSLDLSLLASGTNYHFRLLAEDSLGNATSTEDNIFSTTSQAANVIISEIKTAGLGGADDEWIELYNPTSQPVSLADWSIQYRGGASESFEKKNFSTTNSIPAFGFFLVGNLNYTGGVPYDMGHNSFQLSSDGGTVFLVNNQTIISSATSSSIIDKVAYGVGSYLFAEGEVFTLAPLATQSIERKALATSSAALLVNGAHQWQGNSYDSDNNSQDFVLQSNPNPQNSLMLTESRANLPNLMNAASWPTWQGNLARSGLVDAVSLATSTLVVKWTATTTATHEFTSRLVIDDMGNIYIGRADGLAKYSSNGNLIWLYNSDAILTTPLLSSDDTVYYRGSGALFAVNQEGRLKWKYNLSGSSGNYAVPAILSDGTLITQSAAEIYAINQDATLKWSFNSGRALVSSNSIGAFVVDSADNIYATIDNYIYVLDRTGTKLWEKNLGGSYSSSALGADNILYISATSIAGVSSGGFYALNAVDGSIRWADADGSTDNFNDNVELASVVDSSNNMVYAIMLYGSGAFVTNIKLQAYNAVSPTATSTPSWMSGSVGPRLAAPIMANNKIYLIEQNILKVFDAASGNLDGTFDTGDNNFYLYFGAVGSDGVIYSASNQTLYAIGGGG